MSQMAVTIEDRMNGAGNERTLVDRSILSKAFRGELVPQDPNDEPASVLLERIRAQKQPSPAPKRAKKARG